MLFIIYLSFIFLIQPLLEARAEIQKYFCWFLVQMKSLEFAFEINWPLTLISVLVSIFVWIFAQKFGAAGKYYVWMRKRTFYFKMKNKI